MDFKIEVVSEKILKGERSFDFLSLFKLFLKHNVGVLGFNICKEYVLNKDVPTFLFMHDEKIDQFLEKEKTFFAGQSEIIDDIGVLKPNEPFVIIPLEADIFGLSDKLLAKICEIKDIPKLAVFRLFGESGDKVKEKLSQLNIKAEVVSTGLLSDIYLPHNSSFISEDETKLTEEYENQIYCESYMPMSEIVGKLLNLSEVKLSISDSFTGGRLAKEILSYQQKNVVSDTFNLVQEDGFLKIEGQDRCFGDEQDAVYQLAYSKLSERKCDVSVALAAKEEGSYFKIFVAIGSQKAVDVYKLSLTGTREDAFEVATNSTIFNLIKKLRSKDFAK